MLILRDEKLKSKTTRFMVVSTFVYKFLMLSERKMNSVCKLRMS